MSQKKRIRRLVATLAACGAALVVSSASAQGSAATLTIRHQMPSPTDGKFWWSTKRMITPPISARPTNVKARPMVTERALTILRIRRSTKDVFLPGLRTLSGTSWKFNDHRNSP